MIRVGVSIRVIFFIARKIPLLTHALGRWAKRAHDDRVSCIQKVFIINLNFSLCDLVLSRSTRNANRIKLYLKTIRTISRQIASCDQPEIFRPLNLIIISEL